MSRLICPPTGLAAVLDLFAPWALDQAPATIALGAPPLSGPGSAFRAHYMHVNRIGLGRNVRPREAEITPRIAKDARNDDVCLETIASQHAFEQWAVGQPRGRE